MKIHGIIPAMVTPFHADESLNEDVLRQLVNHLIAGGVHGLFPTGSQGEFYALTPDEKQRVWEIVVDEAAGRTPVYAGTGAITTREVIALNKRAERAGIQAVSVLTPMFINPTQDELYHHYIAIADATSLPVLLYNNPGRTGVHLSADLVGRLAEHPNIAGVKDSSGDLSLTLEYLRQTEEVRQTKDFAVLMGRDTLIYAGLLHGTAGAIAATANVAPALVVAIYEAFIAGDLERALAAQNALAPLRQAFALGTFPGVIKYALALLDIPAGPARGPVGALSPENYEKLRQILEMVRR
jgi:4-hydroxy-tetrahydrodipicolinate synthase